MSGPSMTPQELLLPVRPGFIFVTLVAALLASAVTGIMFGMIPAARAAKLDPVEALRHE